MISPFNHKNIIYTAILSILPSILFAKNPLLNSINLVANGKFGAYLLIGLLLILLAVIWVLIRHIRKSTDFFVDSWKNEQRKNSGKRNNANFILFLTAIIFSFEAFCNTDSSQNSATSGTIAGLPNFLFYLIICLIILEIVVILFLLFQTRLLQKKKKELENKV